MCDALTGNGVRFDYEPFRISYTPKAAHYLPDILLPNGILVEVKGYFTSKDRSKHLQIHQQYPELDVRFVFGRAHNKLAKKSPNTYASWCDLKGFQWAEKVIPASWLIEAPNKKSLATIKHIKEKT